MSWILKPETKDIRACLAVVTKNNHQSKLYNSNQNHTHYKGCDPYVVYHCYSTLFKNRISSIENKFNFYCVI